ncbi:hypothetical protein PIB30_083986, partial [Stylosanthes scabra]|nr:hypothetical protein [Stylosanthes scabra]
PSLPLSECSSLAPSPPTRQAWIRGEFVRLGGPMVQEGESCKISLSLGGLQEVRG